MLISLPEGLFSSLTLSAQLPDVRLPADVAVADSLEVALLDTSLMLKESPMLSEDGIWKREGGRLELSSLLSESLPLLIALSARLLMVDPLRAVAAKIKDDSLLLVAISSCCTK